MPSFACLSRKNWALSCTPALRFPLITFIDAGRDCRTIALLKGQVPEWTKGADCKSAAIGFQGSNPCLPTITCVTA